MASNNMPYRIVKTEVPGAAVFIDIENCEALDAIRAQYEDQRLVISGAYYGARDPSSPRTYGLVFRFTCGGFEQIRTSALEAVPYIGERFGIPDTAIDILCIVGGIGSEDDNRPSFSARPGSRADTTPPEIVVSVAPSVFDARPTPLALAVNREMARQMREDGIEVDVDCYSQEQQFLPVPNTVTGAAGQHAIPLRPRELLYLGANALFEMSIQPRPDDSYADIRRAPEAAERFTEALTAAEKRKQQQLHLRQVLLQKGWFVPPCVKRIEWMADGALEQALEACRVTAAWYSFIGAGEQEVHERIRRIDRRNGIGDYVRLRNIVAFSRENVAYPECTNPFLRRFCPAGGCPMTELIGEIRNPRLFA